MCADLKNIIDYIQCMYDKLTAEWNKQDIVKINQKKHLVNEISTDENNDVFKLIINYIEFLRLNTVDIEFSKPVLNSSKLETRTKQINSIKYKINNYKVSSLHRNGKTAINKCLNDLMGFRIILNDNKDFEQIKQFVDETYNSKYKCINSSKGEYVATHIYFKKDNYSFQWELQVWNKGNELQNKKSHNKHKQGYVKWENENKEAKLND